MSTIAPGDAVLLVREDAQRSYLVRPVPGRRVPIEGGDVLADEVLARGYGAGLDAPNGKRFWILPALLSDRMQKISRRTQILYAKDAGYILLKLGVGPGHRVIEMGTGSGAMTLALAHLVGSEGRVHSYDARPEHQDTARSNLAAAGYAERVEFKIRQAGEAFDEVDCDAVFLDLPEPWRASGPSRAALRPGAPLALLVPTIEQLKESSLRLRAEGFLVYEESEIFHRKYKVRAAAGVRPEDRMVGHTGFLLFARALKETARPAEV